MIIFQENALFSESKKKNMEEEWGKGLWFINEMRVKLVFLFLWVLFQWDTQFRGSIQPVHTSSLIDHLTPLIEASNNNLHLLSTHCQETQKHFISVMCCDRCYYPVRDIATNHPIINLQIPGNQRVLDKNQCDYAGYQPHQTNLISSNVRMTGLAI